MADTAALSNRPCLSGIFEVEAEAAGAGKAICCPSACPSLHQLVPKVSKFYQFQVQPYGGMHVSTNGVSPK